MILLHIDTQITLRPFHTEDAELLYDTISRNRAHLRKWLAWVDQLHAVSDAGNYIQQGLNDMHAEQGFRFGIYRNELLIGGMEMRHWDQETKRAEIGYWIDAEYEGRGYMYRCVCAFIEHVFQTTGCNKLELSHTPANSRSAALAQRLGFRTEGVLRAAMRLHGRLQDKVVQGLLREEWLRSNANANP